MPKRKSIETKSFPITKKKTEFKDESSDIKIEEKKNEKLDENVVTDESMPFNLKMVSWNINGIRAWNKSGGIQYLLNERPDILALQEIKCSRAKIPSEIINVAGYHSIWSAADKEGYAGTALYSRVKPLHVTEGLGIKEHDTEGRLICAEFEQYYFLTAYVPNSGRGLPRLSYRVDAWDKSLRSYLKDLNAKKPLIFCGDLNVAHQEIDLANPKSNKRTAGFTIEERESFDKLLADVDLVDTFRYLHPDKVGAYSFWTYMGNARSKNVGWRLDYFLVSRRLVNCVVASEIESHIMGSDHCPVLLKLKL